MTNYWIFCVKDVKIANNKKNGIDIYNQRMIDGFWGIKPRTPNYKRLKKGDNVVFYLAGNAHDAQKFIGTATLSSEFCNLSPEEWEKVSHGKFFSSKSGAQFKEVNRWETHKPIQPLIEQLDFIENPEKWGNYLRGGIRSISEDDYDLIVSGKRDKSEEIKN